MWTGGLLPELPEFEHISIVPSIAEQYFNLCNEIPKSKYKDKFLNRGKAEMFLNNVIHDTEECQNGTIQSVDNCWDVVYKQPFVSKIIDSYARKKMHQNYLLTSKPSTGFPSD
eukprot:gene13190-27901_t